MMAIFNPDAAPTERELQVLRLRYVGLTYPEIASELGISRHTVDCHIQSLYKKLDVHNAQDAFQKLGWIQ